MPFEKVEKKVDFPAQEREVLALWDRLEAFEKLRQKNRGGPRWSFLDGPITANNPMGVHHAWGRTYKDAFQRYHAMLGQELRYQNGFDCQGLWVEVEVEKELKLSSKRDIENLVPGDIFASVDKFVQLCKERVDEFARIQTEQSIRLGYWMNWDRTDADWAKSPDERKSYFTMSEENNYTIWSFLKKCHDRGLVYRGYDAMPWCPRCGVGLSEMEVKEGYKLVSHRSVFVKFPLLDRPGENLLVWTTTPWTLSSNVGAAVNPELPYLKIKHKGEVYYVGKTAFRAQRSEEEAVDEVEVDVERPHDKKAAPRLKTIEQLFKEKGKEGFEVDEIEVIGKEMVGWKYAGPFDELPAQAHPGGYPPPLAEVVTRQKWAPAVSAKEAHRVVAWKEVGATTGTGIVHIAPGCGGEDFQLGKKEGLPPVAPLDDAGAFLPGFGPLEGKSAVDPATADFVLDNLRQMGVLFATELYPHSYPHCWRCKTELLFRLVDEWFIKMGSDDDPQSYRCQIMQVTKQVEFLPESINGRVRELKWLEQMHDWMISKKRFWGLALPIWIDEKTGDFEVIGSYAELKERAVEGWNEFEGRTPHRPWIDKVKIRNLKTGNLMRRIADVGNPWLDAGIVPYSTMGYNKDRAYWEKWFPADFITESFPGQFRNWFYAILAMSTMMTNLPPFKVLLGHALVRDEHGETMSKAKGNSPEFYEAADRMGADVMRWLYCRANPALNINFGYGPADELRSQFVLKLWHTYSFFCDNARQAQGGFDLSAPPVPIRERPDLDRWILSDLQKLIETARKSFDSYDVAKFCAEAERFVDDKLSNWYIRRSKGRFWKGEQERDKLAAYQTLYHVLLTLSKLFAPIMPFLTEAMYQNLVPQGEGTPISVHLCDYPAADPAMVDEDLSNQMDALLDLVTLGLAARSAARIKVRQPLAEMKVQTEDEDFQGAVTRFPDLLRDELNVKKVSLHQGAAPLLTPEVRPNNQTLAKKFKERLKEVQMALASASPSEVAMKVQKGESIDLPGEFKLEPGDVVVALKGSGDWAGVADRGTQVALDTRITEDLAREGMARDVVRLVQEQRKQANLEIEDRITLHLGTDSPTLRQAIDAHRDYIAGETLATGWSMTPLNGAAHKWTGKIDKHALTIELLRAPGN
jgi:isoleucyl-tRNA synthetase